MDAVPDAVPERFYYVPLPRLSRPRLRGVRQVMRFRMPLARRRRHGGIVRVVRAWRTHALDLALWVLGLAGAAMRRWRATRRATKVWWRTHVLDVALCLSGLAGAVVVALVAAGSA